MNNQHNLTAHYHLPGLFEFYELYSVFLPLFRKNREMFYTGATSARFTAHRLIVYGAAAGQVLAKLMRATCLRF